MTTLPTFAECAAVPPEKRNALQNLLWNFTYPLAYNEEEMRFFRKQLAEVVEEERKERDALAAQLREARELLARYLKIASQFSEGDDFTTRDGERSCNCVQCQTDSFLDATKEPTT